MNARERMEFHLSKIEELYLNLRLHIRAMSQAAAELSGVPVETMDGGSIVVSGLPTEAELPTEAIRRDEMTAVVRGFREGDAPEQKGTFKELSGD